MERIVKGIRQQMIEVGVEDVTELHKLVAHAISYRTLLRRMDHPETFRLYELDAILSALGTNLGELVGGKK